MRFPRWLLALAFVACVRPNPAPIAAPTPPPATPEVSVSFREDPSADGLTIDLYDARPAADPSTSLATPTAEPLSDADTRALLARLPTLPAPASADFAIRKDSLPPPRTGAVVPFGPPTESAAPSPVAAPLTVTRHAPDGAVAMAPQLSISFSRPMIPLTAQDEAAAYVPVTLTPTPKGQWRWLGTQTLIFDADPRFPMATRYTAEVPAGTRAVDGSTLETGTQWTFETPPPSLVTSYPTPEAGPQPLEPVVVLTFDQAISAEALLPFLRLDGQPERLRLATTEDLARSPTARDLVARGPADRVLAVTPTSPLSGGARHTVTLVAGAPSAEGPLPTVTNQKAAFDTYGPLTVAPPTCWSRPCPPDAPWTFEFSNPLDEYTFDPASFQVTPAVPGLDVSAHGNRVIVMGAFVGRTTYTIQVPAAVRDTFGQTLGETKTFTVDVGPASRGFAGPSQAFVTLDPTGSPSISVYTVNQPSLKVTVHRVTPADWTAWTAWWSRWRWEDARKGVLPGTKVWSGTVPVTSSPDRQVETRIDLSPHLRDGLGQLIIQVEPAIQGKNRWDRQEWLGWVQRTRLGLTVFQEPEALTTWVTTLADGKPVREARVALLPSGEGRETTATTTADGLARADLTQAAAVTATVGGDTAILPNNPWGYDGSWVGWHQLDQLRWFVFDDKHLYKPKETVHVRGWLRVAPAEPGELLRSPPTKTVRWRATSSRNNPLGEGTAKVSGLGGFSFDLTLPDTPDLGDASVQIVSEDGDPTGATVHSFTIQEFRTPEFEVSASGGDGVYTLGEDATVDVTARYYAGGSLPAAAVTWAVTATDASFTPPGRGDWSFGPWSPWWRWWSDPTPYRRPQVLTSATDAGGTHRLGMHFAALSPTRPMSVHAEATVTDTNRQAWTASKDLLVHPAAWYVGLRSARAYVEAKRPIEVESILVDRDGKVVSGDVSLTFRRLTWKRVGGTWKEVAEDKGTRTIPGGSGKADFTPEGGGQWAVLATVKDPQGRRNETELRVWVGGEQQVPDRGVDREQVTLVPDRETLAVGDTAKLLVQAPFWPAEGLLTVRAGTRLLETRAFPVKDASTLLELPISEAAVPDLTVAVDLVGARTRTGDDGTPRPDLPPRVAYAGGTVTLKVPPKGHTLSVAVTPALARLSPGEKTSVDLVVTDANGRPVPDAELAIVAVDEAVLSLTGYRLPDPLAVLYSARGDGIQSFHLRQWVNLVAPPAPGGLGATGEGAGGGGFAEAEERADGAVLDRAPARMSLAVPSPASVPPPAPPPPPPDQPSGPAITLRSNFSAVALWSPAVRTDASGRARVPMEVPDSLTRYRVMVVAAAGSDAFGSGEADVTARLPLMVRPSLPRFLNFGDRAELPVVLQNQTSAPLTVAVALRSDLLTPGSAGRRVTVPADDRVEVRFPVTAGATGTAHYQIAAASGAYADAASGDFPVWTPATTEAFATYGTFEAEPAMAQSVRPPADVWKQFGGLEVEVSSTQLQSLTDAFLYLQRYPYLCNEQLASRVLSVAALRDVLTAFSAKDLPPPAEIEATMAADLAQLARRQNADGGWAFWRKNDPNWPYLSVHVTNAFVRAKAAGYPVDDHAYKAALHYTSTIEKRLPSWYSPESKRVIRAYALDVLSLAGVPDAGRARALYAEAGADGLGAQALGWLLPTFVDAKAKEAAEIQRWLANHLTESAAGAHFVTSTSDGAQVLLHSDRVADGVLLEALLRTTPKDSIVPKLVNGLLAHRTAGRWGNTNENAFVLLALNRYFRAYEGTTPDFVARLWLGQGMVGEQRFAGRTTDRATIQVPMDWLQAHGEQTVTLGKEGAGRLYYRMGLRYAPTDLDPDPADRGFTVTRRYEAIDDPADVRKDADGTWTIRAGARVRVRIEMVTPMRRYHVALVDPLPAGLEVQNPDLVVTGSLPPDPSERPRWGWWDRPWYEHENLRDERVEAFTSLLWDGVYRYTYVARATTPGTFVVPPAHAEEMYTPETFGRSGGDTVIIR